MRLLSLTANQPSFHAVTFNRSGLSLVVAEQRTPKSNRTGTYNGVGKSLLLELVHFCLGANVNKQLQVHLKEWTFSLSVEVEGTKHLVTRSIDKPSKVSLDGSEITNTKYKEWLQNYCFEIGASASHLSFRSLIRRFVRSGRGAYTSFFHTQDSDRKDDYGAMVRNAFLLGLDVQLADKKRSLRSRQEQLSKTIEQLDNEPLFADLLADDKVEVELAALREQAAALQENLTAFRVAEDYHSIEHQANEIKHQLDPWRRNAIKLADAISQIDRSLQTRADLPRQRVYDLYEEARHALPDHVRHRIEEVFRFQSELQQRRVFRLTKEREELEQQRVAAEDKVSALSAELNAKLRYLSEHRALDEYVAVSNELADVRGRLSRIEESKEIRQRVSKELQRIRRDLLEENIKTSEYLARVEGLVAEASTRFRSYVRELYGAKRSGLTVSNDEGENRQRYRIEAHIQDDAAEGINEAKLFCYDMTLLTLRRGHSVEFLVHDSTLYGAIDPRQRLTMFRIAERVCSQLNVQYIATLNLHDITSVREQSGGGSDDIDRLFGDQTIVLRLADDSPQSKLLGIQVDMSYLD